MSAMAGFVRGLLTRIPPVAQVAARLNDLSNRVSALEQRISALPDAAAKAAAEAEQAWVQATVVANLKDKIAALEQRLAQAGQDDAAGLRQRVRDLEEYLRLGGREPPR
jgi:hypothetical protein